MIPKGLQLIAQFNFQRAMGVFAPQKLPIQGTKRLSADLLICISASETHFFKCEPSLTDPHRLSTNYFCFCWTVAIAVQRTPSDYQHAGCAQGFFYIFANF